MNGRGQPLWFRLRQERIRRDYSQREAAERSGMSQQQWSMYECGRHAPRAATLVRMARALDLDVSELIG